MNKTSPREVLLHYGKWIGATEFTKLLSEKRQVTQRHAKTLITKAYRNNEVTKHIFPDRRVWYGLPEFGPPTSVNLSQVSSFPVNGWNPPPDFAFSPKFVEAHRRNREPHEVDDDPAQFPRVPFNWKNWSPYQLNVQLIVCVFLGGRFLSIINDPKGYYNGKAKIIVEPNRGLIDGSFTLPAECTESMEETTIEVHAKIYDQNDETRKEYPITKSWSYDPKRKDWFYEPKTFSNEPLNTVKINSWDSLTQAFSNIDANLMEIEIETPRSENRLTIQGIMMLKGAKTMQEAIKTYVSDDYEAFLFSKVQVEKEDKLTWQGTTYKIKEIEDIYDVYSFSYRIAKLIKYSKPGAAVLLF